jgi:phosphate transport system substrate-binding protein
MLKKRVMSRVLPLMVIIGLLISLIPANALARNISIVFDGRTVPSDVQPVIQRETTMVPMRLIFEVLGADVDWDGSTQTITAKKAANTIRLTLGSRTATINGRTVSLTEPANLINNRTMVPIRFVSEALGARVEWVAAASTVRVASTDASRLRSPVSSELRLTTGGATFPFPLYSRLFAEYRKITSPAVTIDYTGVGSGAGIRGLTGRTFEFAGSDAVMTAQQLSDAGGEVLHIPTVMGAVAIVYNIPDVNTRLKLTSEALADIYLGEITRWNDPQISAANPGVNLPNLRITVVRRSDSSGTTAIFTDYLSSVNNKWKDTVGMGTSVKWPGATVGAPGNPGVAAQVSQISGAIGYVELSTAILNRLSFAELRNRSGRFAAPSESSTTAAAAGFGGNVPKDLRMSLVNSPGTNAYPIVGLTWLLVRRDQANENNAKVTVDFLRWAVLERNLEAFTANLYYAPLPQNMLDLVREQLKSINVNGNPVWK